MTAAHRQVPVMLAAGLAEVDADLAELVAALDAAGSLTVASCQNIGEAARRRWPHRIIDARPGGDLEHMAHAIGHDLAYVQAVTGPTTAAFAALARATPGCRVHRPGWRVVQVDFPAAQVHMLTVLARSL